MVSLFIVVGDECSNLSLEIAWEIIVVKKNAIFR